MIPDRFAIKHPAIVAGRDSIPRPSVAAAEPADWKVQVSDSNCVCKTTSNKRP
jgi:hypothetical protein